MNEKDHVSEKTSKYEAKYSADKQRKFTDLLLMFVVEDLQAFNLVNSKSFLSFVYALNPKYICPERRTVKELLGKDFDELKRKLKETLDSNDSKVWYTSDGWSSMRFDPNLALTGHYIDKEFNYKSFLLDFKDFPHPHDQYNISETIYEVKIYEKGCTG